MKTSLLAAVLVLALAGPVSAQYPGWRHSGSVFVLTTAEGANLPASASVENFPLLVRLHKDFFDFAQAQPDGADLRFSSAKGDPLVYQIEDWNPKAGTASVWVRVPKVTGNARQELKLHWGKPDAKSESSGKAVFNESNGYLSVWHMGASVTDEVGTLESKDTGTTAVAGVVGTARHFPGQKGVFGGDKIANYPTGADAHSTEVWFRPEKPNGNVIAWGNEQAQGKVVMQYRSPPHVQMDCYFSGGNVSGKSTLPMGEWVHVVHTYEKGASRLYVNGALDGTNTTAGSPLNIRSPARLWIGGWYGNYNFVGDIDEVRVSKVVRPPEWVKLQYENQKPLQTLVGPVVQPGQEFGLPETTAALPEGQSMEFEAKAGGAQKVYWSLVRDGKETVVATDRFTYRFEAGRVTGHQKFTLRFKAVYPNETKVKDVPVTIKEDIPEPEFTLQAPADWDGRKPIEVVPRITNLGAMKAAGADKLTVNWRVADLATIHEAAPGKLVLKRSQNSGPLTVTASIDNGGAPTVKSVRLTVTEPVKDAWVERAPEKDEKPADGQFYARDDRNEGTLHCNGTLTDAADAVVLKVFAADKPFSEASQKPGADKSYSFAVKLKPGLVKYRVELVAKTGAAEKVLHQASDLVCGDAYLIQGQSNAVATDFGKDDPAFRSDWIRTFGTMSGSPKGVALWGSAVHRSRDAEKLQIGYWGMELGRRLVEAHKVPVCFINGAVGGTRIDQHQRNPADPEDMTTIYGRLLWRVRQAKLTHGVRGILWHQGENDQGADGPTGGYGYETYRQLFIDLAAAWKTDFPNIRRYYVFQIWPKSCSMGINGSDNRLREVQRNLPTAFSNLSVMSTLGIDPPGGCHFPAAGYAEFARLVCPLIERDFYGKVPAAPITPPNLKRAAFAGDKKDEIVLEFDQPVKWDDALAGQFYLDGQKGKVASGVVAGSVLALKLTGPTDAKTVTYLDSAAWSQKTLLVGANGLAALTFCEVPLAPAGKAP
ncbi:MAG: DUF2341 domain-containing protein [Planctomycetes bacterium]|nr:DUF2341 domain-containing protein [Planctomycetota bacterium]